MKSTKMTLPIRGLGCASTAHVVEHSLSRIPGVLDAHVNPVIELAYVEYDPDRCGPADLLAVIESLGYHGAGSK